MIKVQKYSLFPLITSMVDTVSLRLKNECGALAGSLVGGSIVPVRQAPGLVPRLTQRPASECVSAWDTHLVCPPL